MSEEKAAKSQGPIKAAIILLILTWLALLLPVPIVSAILATIFGLITLILGIICLAKGATKEGILLLICLFIGNIIFYFIGLAVMSAVVVNQL